MAPLTERERILILMMKGYGNITRSNEDVQILFNDTFRVGAEQISKSTVQRTIARFNLSGSVKDLPRSGRPVTATNPEKQLDVALSVTEHRHSTVRKLNQQHDISVGSTHNILKKKLKFHPYKIKLVHELLEDDSDRRLQFCELMMAQIDADGNFLNRILFSDEATFELTGNVNRHNFRFWSDNNPRWMSDTRSTQYPQKLNVWAGIINNRIVGPFFIDGNLTAVKYEDMLRNRIIPAIQAIVGDDFHQTWFQQDGAAPHYGRDVRAYLNTVFPARWIGRRGAIEWPARSPDLTPLDYFLWGYLKDRVYRTKPANLDELQQRIRDEIIAIDADMIRQAVAAFYNRIAYCQTAGGENFEHLLK